jgi:hypothetical protein
MYKCNIEKELTSTKDFFAPHRGLLAAAAAAAAAAVVDPAGKGTKSTLLLLAAFA